MSYASNGTANFVGIELVTGILSGKSGSFIIQHIGTFGANGANGASSNWTILPDSGTGELSGINGEGSYEATGESVVMPFSYTIS